LVRRLLAETGRELPHLDAAGLLETTLLETVTTAQGGDVVLYLDGGRPYHVGVLESEDRVVSATLNAGIRRSSIDAFQGEVVYRRVVAPPTPLVSTPGAVISNQ
jgi:hypothetical protein